ncbi:TPA: hypothetical protein ACT2IF_000428 [Streptococcus suis]|uniref:hypothetical protein n=1 Tax=Streptococcus suis TaxID=1307 RepID=UPI0004261863|nr:hypothetical protein [Streptococcus suis]MCK3976788.1 hypothetical protein [Streptococcus suis]HEL2007514.1 hypothetical protein [Streptococcus suis]HEL2396499.1 hypothetical protein [Streptococcus suis]HEL9618299.1 hypothetical protein [Streptococcus suis]HEL9638405.1 hypothetical protein [Streptococcus suis]
MLVFSTATAKVYKTYHQTEVMSTNQKEQFYRAFKKFAIDRYKRTGRQFDGTSRMFSRNVFSISLYDFYLSPERKNMAMSKKLPNWQYFNTGKDNETICKKTITLIKAAGYKAEYKNGTILMWKVKK